MFGIWKKGKGLFGLDNTQVIAEDIFLAKCCDTVTPVSNTILSNAILSGSDLIWVEDYTFRVPPHSFRIQGIVYNTEETLITLDPSHATLNRSDVIIGTYNPVTNEGVIEVLKGVEGIPAVKPTVNTLIQIEITVIDIDANTTSPSAVSTKILYDENTESITSGDANFDSANTPYVNAKCIETLDFTTGNSITLEEPINLALYDVLQFYIQSISGIWQNNGTIQFGFFNGTTQVTEWVLVSGQSLQAVFPYNFNSLNTDWQLVGIPISAFKFSDSIVDRLIVRKVDNAGADSWKMDLIRLQTGLLPPYVQNTFLSQFINDLEDVTRIIKHPLNIDPTKKKTLEPYDKIENLWLPDNETLIEAGVFTGSDMFNLTHYREEDLITNIITKP